MLIAGSGEPLRRRKIGLALSSGVARGWAHVGVLRALMRLLNQLRHIDGVFGGRPGGCVLSRPTTR